MVSPTLVVNGSGSGSSDVTEIVLDYDPETEVVTPTPGSVEEGTIIKKDTTICFKGREGKVRVVFLSPFNDNTVEMIDSEERKLTVGGVYHFRCFFIEPGGREIEGRNGGILDVQPNRP
jgi:hypothetical protein